MAGRKAPRPLPRPVRWLAMFLALVFVVSLGMVVNHESSKATGGASDASSSTPAKSPKRKKTAKTGGYGGLKAAGIPTPGDWSRQRVLSIVKEQQGDERKVSMKPVGGKGGPVDVVLDTVDRILDPTPSDEEWNDTMQQLFQPDIAGQSHGPSNMARYWWSQRRLNPDLLCTGRQSDNLIIQSYDCSTDRTYQGDADGIVKDTQSWMQGSDRVFFDIPGSIGSSIASSTDPQSVISQYYDAVAIPMDDGMWYVTVACPAAADHPFMDENGDETGYASIDDVPAGTRVWLAGGSVGVGTNQRPCRPVEITVGGQRPFWYIGADDGSD